MNKQMVGLKDGAVSPRLSIAFLLFFLLVDNLKNRRLVAPWLRR
jgi:hypothetical protein